MRKVHARRKLMCKLRGLWLSCLRRSRNKKNNQNKYYFSLKIRKTLLFLLECCEKTETERKQRSCTSAGCQSRCVLLATIWFFRRDSLSVLKLKIAKPFSSTRFSSSSMIHSLVFPSLIFWYSSDVIFSESTASFLR